MHGIETTHDDKGSVHESARSVTMGRARRILPRFVRDNWTLFVKAAGG
jgi:hypothetical protein